MWVIELRWNSITHCGLYAAIIIANFRTTEIILMAVQALCSFQGCKEKAVFRGITSDNKTIGLCQNHYSLLQDFEPPHIKCPKCPSSYFANFGDLTIHLQKSYHQNAVHNYSIEDIEKILAEVKKWRKTLEKVEFKPIIEQKI
jgi:hypothetical protein